MYGALPLVEGSCSFEIPQIRDVFIIFVKYLFVFYIILPWKLNFRLDFVTNFWIRFFFNFAQKLLNLTIFWNYKSTNNKINLIVNPKNILVLIFDDLILSRDMKKIACRVKKDRIKWTTELFQAQILAHTIYWGPALFKCHIMKQD